MRFRNAIGRYKKPSGAPVAPAPTPSPTFNTQPSITGTPTVGNALSSLTFNDPSVSNGTITTRTYLLGGVSKALSYVLVTGDVGALVTFKVDVSGPGGTNSATSTGVAVVAANTITAPVISQTSTTGANPFLWTTAENATFQEGYYWNVQTASSSSFVPQPPSNMVFGGDSWVGSGTGADDYAGYYKSQHPFMTFIFTAVGGTGIKGTDGLISHESEVISANPRVYHIGVGRNDLTNTTDYPTPADWLAELKAHIGRVKAGTLARFGTTPRITVETLCAQQVTGQPVANAAYNSARATVNPLLRAEVGGAYIDAVVDFAANSSIGDDPDMTPAAASSTTVSVDGLHLYTDGNMAHSTGHGLAAPIFAAVIDAQVAASAASAGTVTADVIQEIVAGDLTGSGPITFVGLGTTSIPGVIYLRERVGIDDGAGWYTWGPWSNILTDTLAATSTAVLSTTNGGNKSQYIDVTGTPKLTATMNNVIGATCCVRTTTVASGKRHFEVTMNAVGTSVQIGLCDSALALGASVFNPNPGNGSTAGCAIGFDTTVNSVISANGSVTGGTTPAIVAGDIIVVEFDTTANTVTYRHKRGGTVTSLASLTLTTNIPTNWTAFVGGQSNGGAGDSVTVNFGATTFAITPTSGYTLYG